MKTWLIDAELADCGSNRVTSRSTLCLKNAPTLKWYTNGDRKSSRPDLVLLRRKLKYFRLIVARIRTRHAQCDFWARNILCILTVVAYLQEVEKRGVTQYNEMTILTDSLVPLQSCSSTFHLE